MQESEGGKGDKGAEGFEGGNVGEGGEGIVAKGAILGSLVALAIVVIIIILISLYPTMGHVRPTQWLSPLSIPALLMLGSPLLRAKCQLLSCSLCWTIWHMNKFSAIFYSLQNLLVADFGVYCW